MAIWVFAVLSDTAYKSHPDAVVAALDTGCLQDKHALTLTSK